MSKVMPRPTGVHANPVLRGKACKKCKAGKHSHCTSIHCGCKECGKLRGG